LKLQQGIRSFYENSKSLPSGSIWKKKKKQSKIDTQLKFSSSIVSIILAGIKLMILPLAISFISKKITNNQWALAGMPIQPREKICGGMDDYVQNKMIHLNNFPQKSIGTLKKTSQISTPAKLTSISLWKQSPSRQSSSYMNGLTMSLHTAYIC
jgi:hypothetical protein